MQRHDDAGRKEESPADPVHSGVPSFLDQIPGVLGVFDGPEHVCRFVNAGYRQLLNQRDNVGKTARDMLVGYQRSSLIDIFDRVYSTGQPYVAPELSAPREAANGQVETAFLDFTIKPLRNEQGAVTGVMVHAVDVTEQVRARLRLERLAAEQAAIFMHMADSVIIIDRTDTVTYANEAAQALLGLNPEGLTLDTFLHTIHAILAEDEMESGQPGSSGEILSARSIPASGDWHICRSDGTELFVEATVAPVGTAHNPLGTVMVLRNTTTRHYLDEQKAAFLSSVAHDLRTPVTSIKGRTQMILRRLSRGETAPREGLLEDLERIEASATRVATLISELLEVANAGLGHSIQLQCQPTDLVSLSRDIVSDFQRSADFHTVVLDAQTPAIIGSWDGVRLQRVLANLLSNAVKYSPGGGTITVQVREDEGSTPMAILRVKDEGVGIPAADLPSIFERFRRGHNVAEIAGTGIGLATVEETVRQHDGTIDVESEEGAGTTFTVRLPTGTASRSDEMA
jgi:PAS domain S-box-containing protein